MVHALKQACRVLTPRGTMVDVRPLSVDVPLQVVHGRICEAVGMVDLSPDLKFDLSADKAIELVVREQMFSLVSMETFNYVYIWKTFHGMVVDFAERWEGEINVPDEVLEKARQLYRQHWPTARLRLPMQMKLGVYRK